MRRAVGARIQRAVLKRLCELVLVQEGIDAPCRLTVSFVGDDEIAEINRAHRGVATPTDVLSFPLDVPSRETDRAVDAFVTPPGEPHELGDIIISYPRALAQADEYGHSTEREVAYLLVHGLLHILGYDHEEPSEQREMREREERALGALGIVR
ncbi:MAG: rRNA maturation RNase YbeY [Chloroflexota bacterium]